MTLWPGFRGIEVTRGRPHLINNSRLIREALA
jgi:hypothetical protein